MVINGLIFYDDNEQISLKTGLRNGALLLPWGSATAVVFPATHSCHGQGKLRKRMEYGDTEISVRGFGNEMYFHFTPVYIIPPGLSGFGIRN